MPTTTTTTTTFDPLGWASSTVSSAVDLATSILSDLPFADQISTTFRDLINGPLRDFANTTIGKITLRAIASSCYGPLSVTLGPQLASAAFAIPGLFRGEPVDQAWADELAYRVTETARILSANQLGDELDDLENQIGSELYDQMAQVWDKLDAALPSPPDVSAWIASRVTLPPELDPQALAAQLHITPYAAAKAIGKWLGVDVDPDAYGDLGLDAAGKLIGGAFGGGPVPVQHAPFAPAHSAAEKLALEAAQRAATAKNFSAARALLTKAAMQASLNHPAAKIAEVLQGADAGDPAAVRARDALEHAALVLLRQAWVARYLDALAGDPSVGAYADLTARGEAA